MNRILDKIEIKDLPNDVLKDAARVIGMSKLKELIVKLPGAKIYVPMSVRSITNRKYAFENFNGENYQEIAEHLDITKRSVYRILKSSPSVGKDSV